MRFLLLLLIGYVSALLLLRIFESHFLFFPNNPGRLEGNWQPSGLPTEDVGLRTSDGVKLHAWWIPAPSATITFLAFHGNAGNIANREDIYWFLHETPANVLAVEYQGYGRSEGTPSEAGLYRDAEAGYQYLVRTRGIPPKQIVVFGQSLGTAVAANLAANSEVGAVILEAPFPSASAVARKVFWFLPGIQWLLAGQLATDKRLRNINAPILVVHCTEDPVIPPPLEEQVYGAAKTPRFILRVSGPCHEEASLFSPERYRATLKDFLSATQANAPQN